MVSYLVVNYNTWAYSSTLCETLLGFCNDGDEVILLDNASTEKHKSALNKNVVFIQNAVNTGFAGGVNTGIKSAKNDLIFLLNSDLVIKNADFLLHVVAKMKANEKVGAMSPAIVFENNLIQYAGYTPLSQFTGRNASYGYGLPIAALSSFSSGNTASCHGAAMCLRKTAWEKVGGFPEEYFLYYEEFDFCLSLKKHGYQTAVETGVYAVHKGSLSMDTTNTPKHYYLQRNRMWLMKRNFPRWSNCIALPYILLTNAFKFLLSGNKQQLSQMLKGAWEGFITPYGK